MRILFLIFFCSSTWAEHVLYIGDSHSYIATPWDTRRLGHVLIEHFKVRNIPLNYYAACGASASSWSAGGVTKCGFTRSLEGTFFAATQSAYPALDQIFDPLETVLVIVNLGDNMFVWSGGGKKVAALDVAKMRGQLNAFFSKLPGANASTCMWIGPAYHSEGSNYKKPNAVVDQFYQEFALSVNGRCRLIDSRPMVPVSVPNDGLHFVNAESEQWGQAILREL